MLAYVMWGLILKLWLFPEGARVPISIDMNFLFHENSRNCTVGLVCSVRCCHHLFDPCQNSYFFLAGNPKHNLKVKKSTPIGLPGHDLYQLFEQKCQIATKIWWFFVFLPLLQKLFSFSQMWLDFYGYRSCAILWTMAIIWSAKNPFLSIFWVIYVEKTP